MKQTGRVKHEAIIRTGSRGLEDSRVDSILMKEKKASIMAYMLEPFLFSCCGSRHDKSRDTG